ncbi:22593_t:CDS:2, partial [Cetraspora pellucida]
CCGISTTQNGSEKDVMFNYNWVENPEAQSKKVDYVYVNTDSESDNESVSEDENDNRSKNDDAT